MQEYEGDLFYLISEAEKYIMKNIHMGMRLEGLLRVDVPEIDNEAIREAIINAFCHRDYYEYDSVNIAVFKNRVEIRNPGQLYGNLTIDQIKTEMVSARRNELIAGLFHRIHLIEKWGRGISLILEKEKNADFKEVGNQFIVTFKRKNVEQPIGETSVEKPEKEEERLAERLVERLVEKLAENQKAMLILMNRNPEISKLEMAEKLSISTTAIDKNISVLKKKGLLKRVGSARGGHWEILVK